MIDTLFLGLSDLQAKFPNYNYPTDSKNWGSQQGPTQGICNYVLYALTGGQSTGSPYLEYPDIVFCYVQVATSIYAH